MIVKEQKPLTIKDKCGCIFDEFVLKSAILWMAEKPVAASKTVFMHGRYPAVSIHGKKMHLHRLIYQYANQCILPSYIHVHHIDGDKLNNRVNNLKAIYAPRHMSEHNANKSLTIEHRRKIARANQKRKGIKMKKKVDIPLDELRVLLTEGRSILSISKHFGCDWSTIKARIHDNPELLKE